MGPEKDKVILTGPRKPEWSCSRCNVTNNWRCRIKCKGCERDAPFRIKNDAWKTHREAEKGASRNGGNSSGESGNKDKEILMSARRELAEAKRELKEAKAGRAKRREQDRSARPCGAQGVAGQDLGRGLASGGGVRHGDQERQRRKGGQKVGARSASGFRGQSGA